MKKLDEVFVALSKSAFRSKFHLKGKDKAYLDSKGLPTVIGHAKDFVEKRLASAVPVNDGKQTPFRGHPVFAAQHATACFCRGCLDKWHQIPTGRSLTSDEIKYIVHVIERWLNEEIRRSL